MESAVLLHCYLSKPRFSVPAADIRPVSFSVPTTLHFSAVFPTQQLLSSFLKQSHCVPLPLGIFRVTPTALFHRPAYSCSGFQLLEHAQRFPASGSHIGLLPLLHTSQFISHLLQHPLQPFRSSLPEVGCPASPDTPIAHYFFSTDPKLYC